MTEARSQPPPNMPPVAESDGIVEDILPAPPAAVITDITSGASIAMPSGNGRAARSEYKRIRDFYRYFDQSLLADRSTQNDSKIVSASNTSLTAFCQLAALRLNVRRAFISLIDDETQYVLAEATRTLSLQDDSVHDEGDGLHFGICTVERRLGTCDLVLDPAVKRGEVVVIDDVQHDPRTRTGRRLSSIPTYRFYASAPLWSSTGWKIGSLTVLDDEPREGMDQVRRTFMVDLAKTIVDHLALEALKSRQTHTDRLVTGLGELMQGNEHLVESDSTNATASSQTTIAISAPQGRQGQQTMHIQSTQPELHRQHPQSGAESELETAGAGHTEFGGDSAHSPTILFPDDGLSSGPQAPSPELLSGTPESTATKPAQGTINIFEEAGSFLQNSLISKSMRRLFSRAADTLRANSETDGVAFFDASVSEFGQFRYSSQQQGSSSADEATPHSRRQSPSGTDPQASRSSLSSEGEPESPSMCGLLGLSVKEKPNVKPQDAKALGIGSLPEASLKRLLRRYPTGHIFNIVENEVISTSEEEPVGSGEVDGPEHRLDRRPRKEIADIVAALPGARLIVLLPLWDYYRQRWFAGGFIWTKSAARARNLELDLNFLKAYGNSIMMELSRIDTVESDRAKDTVISSISHELRSPLHGILASAELLRADVPQESQMVLSTIDSCGRTLLDTIEHLLDYSKVNQKIRNETATLRGEKNRSVGRKRRRNRLAADSEEVLNLVESLEEVVDGIAASRQYLTPPNKIKSTVLVILSAAKRENWNFKVLPGAWKVILSNIIGNAFKYTLQGSITIELDVKKTPRPHVSLVVTDTGRGISTEFLNNSLYKAFRQEDPSSSGVGLGLSLVRKTVHELQGAIKIESSTEGTRVNVLLPLIESTSRDKSHNLTSILADAIFVVDKDSRTEMTMGLYHPTNIHGQPTSASANQSLEKQQSAILRKELEATAKNWFGIRAEIVESPMQRLHSILVVDATFEASLSPLNLLTGLIHEMDSIDYSGQPLVLVLCSSLVTCQLIMKVFADRQSEANGHREVKVIAISTPVGPAKFGRALQIYCEWLSQGDRMHPRAARSGSRGASRSELASPALELQNGTKPNATAHQEFVPKTIVESSPREEDHTTKNHFPGRFPVNSPSDSPGDVLNAPNDLESVHLHSPIPLMNSRLSQSESQSQTSLSSSSTDRSSSSLSAPKDSRRLRLLLVDDNNINLNVLVAAVRRTKHAYVTAVNGLEAVQKFQAATEPFDMVFTDISMPIMDGLESTRRIRDVERHKKLRPTFILALTGVASASIQQEAYSSGVNLFWSKPFTIKRLQDVIHTQAALKAPPSPAPLES